MNNFTTSTSEKRNSEGKSCSNANTPTSHKAAVALVDAEMITPSKNIAADDVHDSNDCGNSCDVRDTSVDDVPEIKELQRALEYLISDERSSKLKSNNDEETREGPSGTTMPQHYNIPATNAGNETLHQIPNLVNRILVEHYFILPSDQRQKIRDISYEARQKMTQLLIAVIIEFTEPYFDLINRRKEEERGKVLQQKDEEPQKKKSKGHKNVEEQRRSKIRFEDRAVSWATQCLKLLLQPRLPPSIQSNNTIEKRLENDIHIPELDALLAATGSNDGFEIDQRMQESLLLGVQARSMF